MTPDDPTLTAYALGEPISDADRARIEAAMANDESLRAEVEAIRAMAGQLSTALATEPAPPLPQLKPLVIRRRTPLLHLAAASVAGLLVGGVVVAAIAWKPERSQLAAAGRWAIDTAMVTEAEARFDPTLFAQANLGAQPGGTAPGGTGTASDARSMSGNRPSATSSASPSGWAGTPFAGVNKDSLSTNRRGAYVGAYRRDTSPARSDDAFLVPFEGAEAARDALRPAVRQHQFEPGAASNVGLQSAGTEQHVKRLSSTRDAAVDALVARKLPEIRFDKVSAPEALNFLRDLTQANIVIDDAALPRLSTVQINLRARDIRLNDLLDQLTTQPGVNLSWQVRDGAIVISSPSEIAFVQPNTETYAAIYDNPFLTALAEPLSTFSVDVDTASYANVRRFLQSNQLPPADAVRIEELINYFPYRYAAPAADDPAPFRANVELADCPWNANAKLLRVALKGKEIAREARPPSNLVFLIDVSGSMDEPNKLPLVKQSLAKLVQQLDERDTVSIVVYAGASGMALAPTRGDQKQAILNAINELQPGGSTNGAAGIELAYQLAVERFLPQGTNRVMLLTDGDFNVGISDRASLVKLIEEKAKTNVYLSVLGFGTSNLKDATMEELAGKGNGNAAYIDSDREAQKVLVEQMSGTLVTIAKDVKLQLEFNPRLVKRYRLIGYENRMLQKQDFNDDKKDAGDIGAGHAVTALYEIEPIAPASPLPAGPHPVDARGTTEVDPLRYQTPAQLSAAASAEELGTLKLRYKDPTADAVQGTSKLIEVPIASASKSFDQASEDFRFASSVAGFGMLVRGSPHRGSLTWPAVKAMAQASLGDDTGGYRAEFLTLIEKASVAKR